MWMSLNYCLLQVELRIDGESGTAVWLAKVLVNIILNKKNCVNLSWIIPTLKNLTYKSNIYWK